MITIRTFGGLSASRDGQPLTGTGAQPRRLAVLALVARAGDRGITRERLLGLLWPDSDEENGRASLSQALSTLRRELGDGDLFTGVQALRLNQATAACDALDFEAALAAGEAERAVTLYTGPFLEGFRIPGAEELDRWIDDERNHLAARFAEALERLGRQAMARGDATGAVGWWRRRAGLDPLNARVTLELMRALAAAGERHAAIQQARIYEALLGEELSLVPDRAVLQFAEELRTRPADVLDVPPVPAAAPPPVTASAPSRVEPVETSEAAPTLPTSAPARRRTIVAAALGVAVVAAIAFALGSRPSPRDPESPLLAVGNIVDYRDQGSGGAAPVSDMLATNLARVPGLQVMSSMRLIELSSRQSADPVTAMAAAARTAGASELLEGGLHALAEGRLLLELRRVELASGAVRNAYRLEGGDVFELVTAATREIAASLGRSGGSLDPGDVSTRSLVAYRFYEEGLHNFARGDFRTAHQLFDAAAKEDSNFAMAAFYRFLSLAPAQLPLPEGELERLDRLALRATERERLLIRGYVGIATQAPQLLALAETLAVRYPAEVDGHYLLALGRLVRGEFAEAMPHARRVLLLDSAMTGAAAVRCRACDAFEHLAHAYHALDSLPQAEHVWRDWLARDSASVRAWIGLAGLLASLDRAEEALAARRRGVTNPPDVYSAIFPAILALRAGRFDSADRRMRAVMETGSPVESAEARWNLALSLRHQSRWREGLALMEERLTSLTRAERAGDHDYLPKMLQALVLFDAGRPAEAARIWDSIARNRHPTLREPSRRQTYQYVLLSEAALAMRDTAAVARAADSAAAWAARGGNPRDAHMAEHARGMLLLARGDTAGATAALAEAIFSPTLGFTRSNYVLGKLLIARGRSGDAVPLLRAALRGSLESANLYVTHTDLHEQLARAFGHLGQRDSAMAHWRWVARALEHADPGAAARLAEARRALTR